MNILVIGGNRFVGRRLVSLLLEEGHSLTLLNRGNIDDGFGSRVQRLKCDRQSRQALEEATSGRRWDLVFDQVCYTAPEARTAVEVFREKADRTIVASTESVYDPGLDLPESAFDPSTYRFDDRVTSGLSYQEGKRQAEVVFTHSGMNVALVRLSLVVGADDYTGRLKWHLDRIAQGLPIYFPDLEIESDFIRADQAAEGLKAIGLSAHTGPVNLTTPGRMRMRQWISLCEKVTGKKANLVSQESEANHSPYGGGKSKTMSTKLLQSLGVQFQPSAEWMEQLIVECHRDK